MKKTILLLVSFLLSCAVTLTAQTSKLDSLKPLLGKSSIDTAAVNTFNAIGKAYEFVDQDSSLHYINKALQLAQKLHFDRGLGVAYTYLGYLNEDRSEFDSAFANFERAYSIFLKTGNKTGQADKLKMLGEAKTYMGDLKSAIEYYQKSLALFEEIGSEDGIADANYSIGVFYQSMQNYTKSLEYYNKSLEIRKKEKTSVDMANVITAIGCIYNYMGNYNQAKENYALAKSIYETLHDDNGLSNCINWMAITAYNEKDITNSIKYFTEALALYEKINNVNGLMYTYNNIGNIYTEQGDFKKAIEWENKSLEMAQKYKSLENIRYAYEALASTYAKMGDFKNAYTSHLLFTRFKDSLYNENTSKQISELDKKYETAKKDKELVQKDAEIMKQSAEAERQNTQRNYFIFGFAIMLILVVFVFRSYRQKQKANTIIALQKAEVEKQKEMVEQKQKEILDSISYAQRLQNAILPPIPLLKSFFPELFVLFKPKDIVAGDFYWMEKIGSDILIAAADCTGHGVPGAMVSVVCSNALNRTVKEFKITEPGKILDKVRELVIETFEKSESEVKDGMDISLCCISPEENGKVKLKWSGANNPLWYINNNELKEIKAHKQPIGKIDLLSPFKEYELELNKGDLLYLFTDGYADQFGGVKGKKFKYKPLQELLLQIAKLPMVEQKEQLSIVLENWKGQLEQVDDILIIGIKI